MKKILFYSDTEDFGGHEIMSVKIANYLSTLKKYEVEFLYRNKNISNQLNNRIKTYFNNYKDSTPFPFVKNLNLFKILKIKKNISFINPDIIIVCQGNIELSLKGLIASKMLRKLTVSYIPYADNFKRNKSYFATLRDFINKYYYSLPDYFLTPNEFQKKNILFQSKNNNISIIINPIESISDNKIIFNKYKKISLGIIGRVLFNPKNHLITLSIAKKLLSENIDFEFHIIGIGKDLKKFRSIVIKNKLHDRFVFHGWLEGEDKDKIISKNVDIVLIPSRVETGIPLVVYDALKNNKKFLITDFKEIKEYKLPDNFLIDINDVESIVQKIISLNNLKSVDDYIDFKNNLYTKNSVKNFKLQIEQAFRIISCGQ